MSSKSKRACTLCGEYGHNRNNKKFHPIDRKLVVVEYDHNTEQKFSSLSPHSKKQSLWCRERGSPGDIDPNGNECS